MAVAAAVRLNARDAECIPKDDDPNNTSLLLVSPRSCQSVEPMHVSTVAFAGAATKDLFAKPEKSLRGCEISFPRVLVDFPGGCGSRAVTF